MKTKETTQTNEEVKVTIEYKGSGAVETHNFTGTYLKKSGYKGMIKKVSRMAASSMRVLLENEKETK